MTEKLLAYLKNLVDNKFYGKVEITFVKGEVVHINENKGVKLSE